MKFSVASWIHAAIAFISIPIVTRAFSPEEFGKINMFTLSVSIFAILVGLALDQSYVRFFKEKETEDSRKEMLTNLMSICLITYAIFITLIILFGRSLSVYLFGEFNFIITYIGIPIMVLMTVVLLYQTFFYRMSENALGYGVLSILAVFATRICMVFAALFHPTYVYGIIFTVIGLSLVVIGCKFVSWKSFDISLPILRREKITPYLKYSLPLVPVAIIGVFNFAVIRFLLKDYLSYSALGIFTASVTVAGILSVIQSGFATYWTPFMYANYKTEIDLIRKIHSAITSVMVSFSLLIILFSDLIFIILGEEYRSGKNIFALLLISPVVIIISETTCYGIYITKKTHLQFYSTIFSFIVNTIFGLLLIPRLGILGAAITNAIGGLVFFIFRTYFGLKEYYSAERLYRTFFAIGILILASLINYWISDIFMRDIIVVLLLVIVLFMYKEIIGKLPAIFHNLYKSILN